MNLCLYVFFTLSCLFAFVVFQTPSYFIVCSFFRSVDMFICPSSSILFLPLLSSHVLIASPLMPPYVMYANILSCPTLDSPSFCNRQTKVVTDFNNPKIKTHRLIRSPQLINFYVYHPCHSPVCLIITQCSSLLLSSFFPLCHPLNLV